MSATPVSRRLAGEIIFPIITETAEKDFITFNIRLVDRIRQARDLIVERLCDKRNLSDEITELLENGLLPIYKPARRRGENMDRRTFLKTATIGTVGRGIAGRIFAAKRYS